jgi:GAF domain-containing protein/anti-sigma regulatory factor (Ser/Thr protein kinase)
MSAQDATTLSAAAVDLLGREAVAPAAATDPDSLAVRERSLAARTLADDRSDDDDSALAEAAAAANAIRSGAGSSTPTSLLREHQTALPLWAVPLAVLAVLLSLTLALWQAETSLEHTATYRHRPSQIVLWGGMVGSVLTSGAVYFFLRHRSREHENTRRHLRAIESLQSIASAIIARIDSGSAALYELCESARHLMAMDRAGIQLLDAKAGRLELLAYAGDMPRNPPRYYAINELPNIQSSLQSGEVMLVDDVHRLPRPKNDGMLAYFKVRAMILIPLRIQGEKIGLLTMSRSSPATFGDIDRRLAELLGAQAAVIVANSRLHQAQQLAVQRYKAVIDQRELLFSTNAAIYQTGDLDESLRRVAELAPLALGVDLCVVALSAKPPDNVRIAAITPGVKPRSSVRPGVTFFCPAAERAFQRGATCVFANAATDRDVRQVREAFPEAGSVACVPLCGREGSRIGVLTLIRRRPGPFSAEQLKMARLFSIRAAAAIENARLHQETRKALEQQKKLLEQRDSLWSVNAAVYRAGTLDESLDRIVSLAPAALDVDMCGVDLVTENAGELYLAAITPIPGSENLTGHRFTVRGLAAGRALESGKPVFIEDSAKQPGVHPDFCQRLRIGSIAFLPLTRSDGKALGLLVLARHEPGPYDEAKLEIARVFATRAASAIENAQLFEQTRRDAMTKAMLLRELNHRVKNNLAGIVGLLSMGEPEMGPVARRWLDRVTDRVRLMAEAHDLFTGDAGCVTLTSLVDRTLSSLSVARSAGVEMRVDMDGAPAAVELRAEQAISLAMALHELCYNAIVHGLRGAAGVVTLRARLTPEPRRLTVDVIDSGRGIESSSNSPAASGESTGIGLELVRGLVSRELRGRFSLSPAPGGGTVATVEFPLQGALNERHANTNG